MDATLKLVEELQSTGISAIGVHGRQKHERPQHANNTGTFYDDQKNHKFLLNKTY